MEHEDRTDTYAQSKTRPLSTGFNTEGQNCQTQIKGKEVSKVSLEYVSKGRTLELQKESSRGGLVGL